MLKVAQTPTNKGFTIIELLIVIVVIAILATLVITTYQGVQRRAANSKTIAAARQWATALREYQAENGGFPLIFGACLGSDTYPTGYNDSNTGKCYSGGGYTYRATMTSAMSPYLNSNNLPTPDFQAVGTPGGTWFRGLLYDALSGGSEATLGYVVSGTSTCPAIGGTKYFNQETVTGGVYCRAELRVE